MQPALLLEKWSAESPQRDGSVSIRCKDQPVIAVPAALADVVVALQHRFVDDLVRVIVGQPPKGKVLGSFVQAEALQPGDTLIESGGELRRIVNVEPEIAGHRGVTFADGATLYLPSQQVVCVAYG